MFNYSYIPKWRDLFNFFIKKKNSQDINIIKEIWGKNGKDYLKLFTRSSWIIYLIAFNELKKKTKTDYYLVSQLLLR